MKFVIIFVVFYFISFFSSCSMIKRENVNEEVILVQLNPEKDKKIYFSEIIDSISVIPLETSSQSLLDGISKIDYDGGCYFILNSQDNLVYTFDNKGEFKSLIANKGNGPGEVSYPQCFALDRMNKEVWMTNNNAFYRYDYAGKYLGNKPYSLAFGDFCIEKSNTIYFYTGKTDNSHIEDGFLTGHITMLSPKGEKRTWFKSQADLRSNPNESVMNYSTRIPFSEQADGSITCHYVFSDTIYSINGEQITPSYVVNFGENSSKINLNQMSGPDVKAYMHTHSNIAWYMREVIETSNILRFSYNFGFESYADVYYNKRNGHLLEGMPINDLLGGYIRMLGNKENRFIGCMLAGDVQLNTKLSSFIPEDQLSELRKITPESNPILIEFTLKDF